jgi:zinc transport system permease protein
MNFLQSLSQQSFLQIALAAGLCAAIGCGVVGSIVVVRRIAFLAGGIAHAALGGMGLASYFGADPVLGATAAAVLSALLIGWISLKARQHEDMLIGAVWAVGMAIGILAVARTPGYNTDLMSYLLGNLLMVTTTEVWMMAALNAVMLVLLSALYRPLLATLHDEEFARLRGLPTTALYLGLLVIVALAVVILLQAVGMVLVMALLTLPAATALLWAASLTSMMLLATGVAAVAITGGLGIAFESDSPAGATIVLCAAGIYLLALLAKRRRRAVGQCR